MKIPFRKYQGTGNDFIMIDQREHQYLSINDIEKVAMLCDRRFGIGGDGLIIIEKDAEMDFKMVYFNSDGHQSSMCGNGGRCIVQFAHDLGMIGNSCTFIAIDGPHAAMIAPDKLVHLKMIDTPLPMITDDSDYVINTGSPHYVKMVETIPADIKSSGAAIRYNDKFKKEGININFVVADQKQIEVATYERGVEDETYSCGTGVVASAIVYATMIKTPLEKYDIAIKTKGGNLRVKFKMIENKVQDIWLVGPAVMVFEGVVIA